MPMCYVGVLLLNAEMDRIWFWNEGHSADGNEDSLRKWKHSPVNWQNAYDCQINIEIWKSASIEKNLALLLAHITHVSYCIVLFDSATNFVFNLLFVSSIIFYWLSV